MLVFSRHVAVCTAALALLGCGGTTDGDDPVPSNINLQIQVLSGTAVPTPITDEQVEGEIVAFRDREADGVDYIQLSIRRLFVDRPGHYRTFRLQVKDFGINVGDEFPLIDGNYSNAAPPAALMSVIDVNEADPMGENNYGWRPASGTIRLSSFSGDRYTFELQNVRLRHSGAPATGEIAVTGTLTFDAPPRP